MSLAYSRPSQTKIIATIGPSCDQPVILRQLISSGVDVVRINSAHSSVEDCARKLTLIRAVAEELAQPVAVLLDLAGPKLRLGRLVGDQVYCRPEGVIRLIRGDTATQPDELVSTYPSLVDEIGPGDRILLADGTVELRVEEVKHGVAFCRVIQPGVVRSRQGINVIGVRVRVRALTPQDREFAIWAAENAVDFVGLSFVRLPEEVNELKALLQSRGSHAQVVAKIEKVEALERLDEIVQAADVVMVARGDLGIEADIAELGVLQKRIIRVCRQLGRPVIVATQMLDSMQSQLMPTRAEVADVANAIIDGADACMLSGETAVGQHPVEAVSMMHRIALATEPFLTASYAELPAREGTAGAEEITEAAAEAAVRLAVRLRAKCLVAGTARGHTALKLSRYRSGVPIVGVTDNPATWRRMCLYWGVIPLLGPKSPQPEGLLSYVLDWGKRRSILAPGDIIVLLAGHGFSRGAQNMIMIHQVD
ncbi:MAG: pyruvate kinase [Thermoguttaceae bacterium]|nr:pyruvate kinase [Thermoguttaceae bacterium]MDW8077637.1 pyruvate kinase [Thermoguttaceae bacterium]